MNKNRSTTLALSVSMVLCLVATVQPVSAGVEEECRQEADDYGVMPELRNEYIDGCIESRGGTSTSSSVEPVDLQSSESDDTSDPAAASENVAE